MRVDKTVISLFLESIIKITMKSFKVDIKEKQDRKNYNSCLQKLL